MTKIEHFEAQRDVVENKLRRIDDFIKSFDATKASLNHLKVRLEILSDARKDFDQLQYEIEQLDKTKTIAEHMKKRAEFEESYCNLVTNIKDILDKPNVSLFPSADNTAPASNQIQLNEGASLNLPILNLKTFNGNYKDWLNFENSFKSIIDENKTLNNRQRLQYLKSCLLDEALRSVDTLTINENNYKNAWDILEKRFKNKRLIIHNHVFSILNAPALTKSSPTMLRELLDNVFANVASLKTLGIEIDMWHALIVPIITEKLDFSTKRDWQSSLDSELPTYEQLIKFLEKRCFVLESLNTLSISSNKPVLNSIPNTSTKTHSQALKSRTVSYATTQGKRFLCLFCKNTAHSISQCDKFINLNSGNRLNEAQYLKLCTNCLRNNHLITDCRSKSKCRTCSEKHHTLLHSENELTVNSAATVNYQAHHQNNSVLLSTALILIKNSSNEYRPCRIFLDQGSMSNFITFSMLKELNLKSSPSHVEIKGLNGTISTTNQQVLVEIKSKYNSFSAKLNCFVVEKITENLPLTAINPVSLEIPKNLYLADPNFYEPNKVDLLIGAELFWNLLCIGQVKIPCGLVLQKTHFGFIAGGSYSNSGNLLQTSCNLSTTDNNNLERQMEKFLALDNITNDHNNTKNLSQEELECENHFKLNTTRAPDGRFIVKLPIKNNKLELGETRSLALKRFHNIERKLNKNLELKLEYSKFIKEYHNLNHMELVAKSFDEINNPRSFLPHHAVFKNASVTTRLRVVFDASLISENGFSLNDNLMSGPIIQSDLFTIATRFRLHKYVLNADIAKMYRQIRVQPEDANLQLIFWRDNLEEPIKTFKLTTLTYGTKPASFLATRCLKQLADENEINFPKASEIIRSEFYMDDLMTGANSVSELIDLKNQITGILKQGGFELRKFQSNCRNISLLDNQNANNCNVSLFNDEFSKVLGLYWNSKQDIFKFEIQLNSLSNRITKRNILSTMAQIFDPLGLIGPIIMKAKIILQQLWQLKISWDESVPSHIHTVWQSFLDNLNSIQEISFPRNVISCTSPNSVEIHGFCDASLQGYGAVIYIRSRNSDGVFETRLLCSKSRVAPLKTITLPRLELNGALLLAQLIKKVRQAINLNVSREFLWTDSTIALAWINTPPSSLKTFIANRVSEIISITSTGSWYHVRSANNAADILSRGALPSELTKNNMWFNGPDYLKNDESVWHPSLINSKIEIPELRVAMHIVSEEQEKFNLTKFSKFKKLQRVVAWTLRFIHNCKNKRGNKIKGILSVEELENSVNTIIHLIQNIEFTNDLKNLIDNKALHKSSKLLPLDPFLDKTGLVRVGGRLKNASIENDVKHPIILPQNHFVTKLIIKQIHEDNLHAGPQATLAAIRQRYWVISGRSVTRQVLHQCIKYFKANPKYLTPKMGDLPASRVQPSRPFSVTGVDYAGPVLTKESRGRGKRLVKSYIAVFVCFATKAAHIELVPDLSTDEFLGAFKRFIGRRGLPSEMYSDNATNFVGANNSLKILADFFKQDKVKNVINEEMVKLNIKWHFIPPKSPHMGGLWESCVKSIKSHLKRTVGNANLTFSEMHTLLVRIEACLNSRPLTPLSTDPNDLETLTPGHFLIGQPLTEIPEQDLSNIQANRLSRWQLVERLRAHFWKRWSREYLTQLQSRAKWRTNSTPPLQVGDMVILMEDNVPSLCWRIGRVVDTHPGEDNTVRVATVRTNQGTYKRTTRKLCVLPFDQVKENKVNKV